MPAETKPIILVVRVQFYWYKEGTRGPSVCFPKNLSKVP